MGQLARFIPEADRGKVENGITRAVRKSFRDDKKESPTRDEVKRRFDICLKIYVQLRGDLSWGMRRALDHLPEYLRNELDGKKWEPDKRTMWVPGDG